MLLRVLIIIFIVLLIIFVKNKKALFIILGSICAALFVCWCVVVINHKVVKKYTLEEITGVNFSEIQEVILETKKKKSNYKEEFLKEFEEIEFRDKRYIDEIIREDIFKESPDGTFSERKFTCLNKDGKVLYRLDVKPGGVIGKKYIITVNEKESCFYNLWFCIFGRCKMIYVKEANVEDVEKEYEAIAKMPLDENQIYQWFL